MSASHDGNTVALHFQSRRHVASLTSSGTLVIEPSILAAADPDTPSTGLWYTGVNAPEDGELRVDGATVAVRGAFTQDDVDQERVTCMHSGGPGAIDRFELTLSDLGPASPLPTAFEIVIDDGSTLATHLRLDEGVGTIAADVSGNGNDGTLMRGASFDPTTSDGSPSSVEFDGSSGRIDLPPSDVSGGSGLTIALRFRADGFVVSDARLVSQASGSTAIDHVFMFSTSKSGPDHVSRARVRIGGSTQTLVAAGGAIQPRTWHHAPMTHDGAALRLFLDGVEVGSTLHAGSVDSDPTLPVALGAQPAGAGGSHFDGLVDDVRLLRRGLSPTEILGLAA